MDFEKRIAKLNEMIADARHIVFFTGAGISTGSGIPDFRSADGLYSSPTLNGKSPEYMLSIECLLDHEKDFIKYLRENMDFRAAEPNIAHQKISELQLAKKVSVITQNIDGLHEKAGSQTVYNIHGTMSKFYCQDCGHTNFKPEAVLDGYYDNHKDTPKCPICLTGTIRPDVVLYGEGMAQPDFGQAQMAAGQADLLIVVGTSLTVYPAAYIPMYFGDSMKTVIINRDPVDIAAGLVFNEDICDVFEMVEIPEGVK